MKGTISILFLSIFTTLCLSINAHSMNDHFVVWHGLQWGSDSYDQGNPDLEWPRNELLDENLVEKSIVKIVSEPENDRLHEIVLFLDEQNSIQQFARRSSEDQNVFTPEQLVRGEVVLARAADRNAVMLSCPNCNPAAGGTLILNYLHNGVTNTYNQFTLDLVNEGQEWKLYTDEGGSRIQVHNLRLRSRKVANILIGIRKIEVNR